MTDEKHQAEQRETLLPLATSEMPAHRRDNEKSGVDAHDIDLVVGLEEMQRRRRRQQRSRRFLQLLLVTLIAGAFVTHWARSGSGAAAQSEHGRHGHDGPFPWFPSPPPHRGGNGHGPPPPPPHGPPHHRPLQCWSLPEGDSVNISLPLMSSPPPPPPHPPHGPHGGHKHDKQHDAAYSPSSWLSKLQWGRGKHHGHGHGHGHGHHHGPPHPPTVWLHHSLLSSEVSIVRDDLGRPGPGGPGSPPPAGHHEPPHDDRDKDKDSDDVESEKPRPPHPPPPPPHHPMIVMATFSRAPAKDNEEKGEGGEHDDEPSGPKKLDVCTFAAPHGVSVGVFRPPPKHDEGDDKELAGPVHPPKDGPPPPPPHHRRPFPPFPKDQYKEVSAVLHLPQGEPIFLCTVPPPPPPPPHHGHKGGKKEGCRGGAM